MIYYALFSLLAILVVTGSLSLYLLFHYLGIYSPAVADSWAALHRLKQFPLAWLLCGLNLWQFLSNAPLRSEYVCNVSQLKNKKIFQNWMPVPVETRFLRSKGENMY